MQTEKFKKIDRDPKKIRKLQEQSNLLNMFLNTEKDNAMSVTDLWDQQMYKKVLKLAELGGFFFKLEEMSFNDKLAKNKEDGDKKRNSVTGTELFERKGSLQAMFANVIDNRIVIPKAKDIKRMKKREMELNRQQNRKSDIPKAHPYAQNNFNEANPDKSCPELIV